MSSILSILSKKRNITLRQRDNTTSYYNCINDTIKLMIVSQVHKDITLELNADALNPTIWTVPNNDNYHHVLDLVLNTYDLKNIPSSDKHESHIKDLIEFVESAKLYNYCCNCGSILDLPGESLGSCDNPKCINICDCLLLDNTVTKEYQRYKDSPKVVVVDFIIETAYRASKSTRRQIIFEPIPSYIENVAQQKKRDLWGIIDDFQCKWPLDKLLEKIKKSDTDAELYQEIGDIAYAFVKFALKSNKTLIYQSNLFNSQDIVNTTTNVDHANLMVQQLLELTQLSVKHTHQEEEPFKKAKETCYLYHGSSVENWYSIMRNGLKVGSKSKYFKNGAAYGNGIYLSNTISLSIGYSVGDKIIVAVYEVMGNPSMYKKTDSIYVVPDENKVLLKYLLVFPYSQRYGALGQDLAAILNQKFASGIKNDQNAKQSSINQKRMKRLMREYKILSEENQDTLGFRFEVEDDSNFNVWKIYIKDFEGNDNIHSDMKSLNIKEVELEFNFNENYPFEPPFIRVVYPRFNFKTGHVTIGGSICMELLTNQGWDPTTSISTVVTYVKSAILEGDGRIDHVNYKNKYNIYEARQAYDRMLKTHGWI
uniref:UBC core domain-containing protein n=1 Tax=viral metagenome TaxID=1070528 RepID=A0A6C0E8J8_9ZZZZ